MTATRPEIGNKPIIADWEGINEALNINRAADATAVDQIILPTARFLPLQHGAKFIRPQVDFNS